MFLILPSITSFPPSSVKLDKKRSFSGCGSSLLANKLFTSSKAFSFSIRQNWPKKQQYLLSNYGAAQAYYFRAMERALYQKMGLKTGLVANIKGGPDNLFDLLYGMPEDIDWDDEAKQLDWLLTFHEDLANFKSTVEENMEFLHPNSAWWIACKKGLPKSENKLDRAAMLQMLNPLGYVDVLVCSIDAVWSAYKFMKRKNLR